MSDQLMTVQVAAASPIYRRGVSAALQENGVQVVAAAADGKELLAAVATDVIVAQLELPGIAGALRSLASTDNRARVLLLLSSAEPVALGTALRYGPAGLLLQDAGPAEFFAAVQAATAGAGWISTGLVTAVFAQARSGAVREGLLDEVSGVLSRREREVLVLVAAGHSNRRIAGELFIAENTVKNHVRHILAKLDVSSRVEATLYAVSTGLVDSSGPGAAHQRVSGG